MEAFIKKIYAYNDTEKAELETLKKEILDKYRSGLFWYVSSGTDPHPFYLFRDVNVFLYSDYSQNIARKIYEVYSKQKSRNQRLYSLIYHGEEHDRYAGGDIFIEKIFPINIFSEEEFAIIRQSQCCEQARVRKEYTKYNIDSFPQGFIIKAVQSKYEFIIIFMFFTNTSCYNEIINPFELKLKYLCTVCDGCGKGGNWECSNDEDSNFFQTILFGNIKPRYWLTEHRWTGNRYFSTIDRIIEKELWPNGYNYAKVKVFEFNKKTEERYIFETDSYKLSLINYNILACLDSIEENSLFVTSLSLSHEDTEKLKSKKVTIIHEKKLLKGTVAKRILWLNRLAVDKGVTKIATTPFGSGDNEPLLNMDKHTKGENLKIKELVIYYMDKDDYADIRPKMKREKYIRRDFTD
ncbi:MAG: hypothetical protein WHU95_06110 [candidate division WOR-3 bacterium]|jgi:hypothetical protein|nr:hypothetical protein [candidate division WOR-3 bacterium]MDH7519251.1 hypothetical protein [bacterium]